MPAGFHKHGYEFRLQITAGLRQGVFQESQVPVTRLFSYSIRPRGLCRPASRFAPFQAFRFPALELLDRI